MNRALLTFAIIAAGLSATCVKRSPDQEYTNPCEGETKESLLDFCTRAAIDVCEDVPMALKDACRTGCVMKTCPNLHDCDTDRDPKWCGTSCGDAKGGLFWYYFLAAQFHCESKSGLAQPAFGDCRKANVEKLCPELAGTDWAVQWPSLYKK